jgi:hypothetical protein
VTTAEHATRSINRVRATLRRRIPLSPQRAWDYAGAAGSAGGAEGAAEGVDAVVSGAATSRTAVRGRRHLKRIGRLRAKAAHLRERVGDVDEEDRENLRGGRFSGPLDPFVRSFLSYAASSIAVVGVLETTGMLSSLAAFDATLGFLRIPMAIAAGGILVLAGHVIGDFAETAVRQRNLRKALLAAAVAILACGAIAIAQMGSAREANLGAASDLSTASTLRASSRSLESKADRLDTPLPGRTRGRVLPVRPHDKEAARRLRRQGLAMSQRADRLEGAAREHRTLLFFIAVQALGLAVGSAGGYLFARAAPARAAATAGRCDARARRADARADDRRARVVRIAIEEYGYAVAEGGHYGVSRALAGVAQTPVTPTFNPEAVVDRLIADRGGTPLVNTKAAGGARKGTSNGHGDSRRVSRRVSR